MSDTVQNLLAQAAQQRRDNQLEAARASMIDAVSGAQTLLAQALTGLGQIERDLNNIETALAQYQDAAAIYRKDRNHLRLAHTIRHIADIYRETGQPESAEPLYREALEIYRSRKDTNQLDLANAVRGFALLTNEAALWKEARDLYQENGVLEGAAECDRRLLEGEVR